MFNLVQFRLILSLIALGIGIKLYSKLPWIGLLAIVLSPLIAFILGIGLIMGCWTAISTIYQYSLTIILILRVVGIWYLYQAVSDFLDDKDAVKEVKANL